MTPDPDPHLPPLVPAVRATGEALRAVTGVAARGAIIPPLQRAAVLVGAMVASVGIVLVIAVLDAAWRALGQ